MEGLIMLKVPTRRVTLIVVGTVVTLLGATGVGHALPGYTLKQTLAGATAGDDQGRALALLGPYVAVGDAARSQVRIYDRLDGSLVRTLTNPNPSTNDGFGSALSALDVQRLLVGAPAEDNAGGTDAGAVYLFDVQDGTMLKRFLKSTTPTANAGFGNALLGSSLIYIGASLDDVYATDAGAVYCYLADAPYDPAPATYCQNVKKPTPAAGDQFGQSLAVTPDGFLTTALWVGAIGDDTGAQNAGAVLKFQFSLFVSPLGFTYTFTMANPFPGAGDLFGYAIAPVTNGLLVGAPLDSGVVTYGGSAYLMSLANGTRLATYQRANPAVADLFGWSVSSYEGSPMIGVMAADVGGVIDSGEVLVFDPNSPYGQLLTIANPTPAQSDFFGYALAAGPVRFAVGAPGDDALASNGGAAHLYERSLPTSCWVGSDPTLYGAWDAPKSWFEDAVHSTLMHTGTKGQVLFWRGQHGAHTRTYVWDPTGSPQVTRVGDAHSDQFCGGHTVLSDGRPLSIGGTDANSFSGLDGSDNVNAFDPTTGIWTAKTHMLNKRWYPTATMLSDGRVLATQGWISPGSPVNTPEIYDPTNDCWQNVSPSPVVALDNYPFMFLLPDARIFAAGRTGAGTGTRWLTLGASQPCLSLSATWSAAVNAPFDGDGGSAVYYRAATRSGATATASGLILKSGGSGTGGVITDDAAKIDAIAASPTWTSVNDMNSPRATHNLVALPDGRVVAIGGGTAPNPEDEQENPADAVMGAEIWNPATGAWAKMACMTEPRLYHSTAVLLPDGSVLAAGGNNFPSYQIFKPPYLFSSIRPTIGTPVPTEMSYNTDYTVTVGSTDGTITNPAQLIAKVVFIRSGSATHSFDQNQRYVEAGFTVVNNTTLSVKAPASGTVAPPGYYMMFMVMYFDVPSEAKFVKLG